MSNSQHHNELASTYLVPDRYSKQELKRLLVQDHLVTISLGGVLPEQEDPTIFQSVLDVGCGTGGWLIEAAKSYPSLSRLVGAKSATQWSHLPDLRPESSASMIGFTSWIFA